MPKKAPKNAYFYYMLDYKKREERRGNKISIQRISQICSDPWNVIFIFF